MQEQESMKKLFKELESNKNNEEKAKKILTKINLHLLDKSFRFNLDNVSMLYPYLYVANKFMVFDYLKTVYNDKEFIKLLDATNIDGSMLLSLTSNFPKPRLALLTYSKKIRKSILKGDEILTLEEIINDLTADEVAFLRKDIDIDNLLIKKGLSFNTLKEDTKEQIKNNLSILKLYNLKAINDFIASYEKVEELANNEEFLKIYLTKLDNNYAVDCPLFKYLSKKKLDSILASYSKDNIILHLVKNTDKLLQKDLLQLDNVEQIVINSKNIYILRSLPYCYLKKILVKEQNLFVDPYFDIIKDLPLDKLQVIADSNKNYYGALLRNLEIIDDVKFIKALNYEERLDLKTEQLNRFNIKDLTELCRIDSSYKKDIIKNKELCTRIVNSLKSKDYSMLDNLFKAGKFTMDDRLLLMANVEEFKDSKLLNMLLKDMPLSKRKYFYDSNELRNELVNEKSYHLDEYAISYYLNNINEITKLKAPVIKELLLKTDISFNSQVLSNFKVIDILFKYAKEDYHIISDVIKDREDLIKYFNKEYNYFDKELLTNIIRELDYDGKKEFCTKELVEKVLSSKYYNIYKKLLNNNAYLLNTIDFRIFEDYIVDLKLSILSYITKYPALEEKIVVIGKYYQNPSMLINTLYYALEELNRDETLDRVLDILVMVTNSKNRKRFGNLPKLLDGVNYQRIPKKELNSLINYLLYLIPRFYRNEEVLLRPIVLKAPHTYEEIVNYEKETENKLTNLIKTEDNIKDYFIQKHFKLTLEEARLMVKMYDVSSVDINVYNEEYMFVTNLNKILNTDNESLKELDRDYKVIAMDESYRLEYKLKKMYGQIYNYELRSKNNNLKASTINFYNKEITIYKSKEDFLYLVCNLDLEESYLKTKSYFKSYHKLLNEGEKGVPCSLITKDNLVFDKDFLFGYNGLLAEGLIKVSNYYLDKIDDNSKDYYSSVSNLIDQTRDYNNTLYLNKYGVRPNYNDDNIPNIEPDYILVKANRLNDKMYLNQIVNISLEFRSKRHPEGLPIISIDLEKVAKKELLSVNKLLKEYEMTYEPYLLKKVLTKLENNYTAYRKVNKEEALRYDIYLLLSVVINRLNETNSIYELNEIEEIFSAEYHKYDLLSNEYKCNYYLDYLKKSIAARKKVLNKD